ncbi:MAG TPA: phosphocholine cytidylyltransferase family protein [Chloroflexota bacterium]|nr:phosphocholine cytidylyltransferase family protein [Chloroflexota bacterium]
MKAIIIGAGRGRRLMPLTEDQPKCFAEIGGRRILDWILEALAAGGFRGNEIVFVGGYLLPVLQREYPHFTYVENADWERNNILASLFCAEEHMADGFVCSYADILYRPFAVERVVESRHDITLVVDTDFRSRYRHRSLHPETDAEKVRCEGERVVEVSRRIPGEEASGEYIGVAKFTPAGAASLRDHYRRALRQTGLERPFRESLTFRQAYLIHLFQEMLESGVEMNRVDTHGEYHEIDTTEDYDLAQRQWR